MNSLCEIEPIYGTREWLIDHDWITKGEIERVERDDSPNPYTDRTYDWYAGFGKASPLGPALEIGVYMGFSMAAILRGKHRHYACLVDSEKDSKGSLEIALCDLACTFADTIFQTYKVDTQTNDWLRIPIRDYSIVHIDADHSFEACLNDLCHFAVMAIEGGLVVIHDTIDPNVKKAVCDFLAGFADGVWEYREIGPGEGSSCGNIVLRRKYAGRI